MLDVEFDWVKQHMSLPPIFLPDRRERPSQSFSTIGLRLKPIGFISLARMALGKLLWRLGLCMTQVDELCHTEPKGLMV